jgi:ribosomal-protein-alanine N-acetyltransferase
VPFNRHVPIDTARLRIRAFRPAEDAAAMEAVYCDPFVMRFIPGGALAPGAVVELLKSHVAENEARDLGFYALEELETEAVVGEVGFGTTEWGERELGWTLAAAYWGRGYATEAARACLAVADGPLVAQVDVDNLASIRVAEKIGLTPREERLVGGRPHRVFAF